MKAPQFSLRRLFVSATLISIGVAYMATAIWHGDKPHPLGFGVIGAVSMFGGSGACIMAGVFNLFGRLWTGVAIGGLAALGFLGYIWRNTP